MDYKVEFSNNLALNAGLGVWKQTPAGVLTYALPTSDGSPIHLNHLRSTELNVGLRYAPNETFYQGKNYRQPLYNEIVSVIHQYFINIVGLINNKTLAVVIFINHDDFVRQPSTRLHSILLQKPSLKMLIQVLHGIWRKGVANLSFN